MLRGIRSNRVIVGAYVDKRGGVCPMLAAHRNGGRTNFGTFARAWDAFTGAEPAQAPPRLASRGPHPRGLPRDVPDPRRHRAGHRDPPGPAPQPRRSATSRPPAAAWPRPTPRGRRRGPSRTSSRTYAAAEHAPTEERAEQLARRRGTDAPTPRAPANVAPVNRAPERTAPVRLRDRPRPRRRAHHRATASTPLLATDYPADRREILVVDNGSTDGTAGPDPAPARSRYLREPDAASPTPATAASPRPRRDPRLRRRRLPRRAPLALRAVRPFEDPEVGCVAGELRHAPPDDRGRAPGRPHARQLAALRHQLEPRPTRSPPTPPTAATSSTRSAPSTPA